jgi:Tfp pilus assembly protein PilX
MQKGFSLVVAMGLILLLLSLSMVALNSMTSNASLRGGIYAQSIAFNASESCIHQGSPGLLQDAPNNYQTYLAPDFTYSPPTNAIYRAGTIEGACTLRVKDNDDLDGNDTVDTDKRVIVTSEGRTLAGILVEGRTEIAVVVKYAGNDDEYAQESGGSKSNSSFGSEVNVDDVTNGQSLFTP